MADDVKVVFLTIIFLLVNVYLVSFFCHVFAKLLYEPQATYLCTKILQGCSLMEMAERVSLALTEIGCCARCAKRFLGERNTSIYSQLCKTTPDNSMVSECVAENRIDQSTEHQFQPASARECISREICVACLGLLQEENENRFLEKIHSDVKNSGFEFDDFTFALFVPTCLLVRQHSIYLHILEKFSDMKENEIVPSVKEVFKWVYGPAVEEALGVSFKHLGSFKISMTFIYDDNLTELECVVGTNYKPKQPWGRKRRKIEKKNEIHSFPLPVVNKAIADLRTAEEFRELSDCPPRPPATAMRLTDVTCFHGPLYIAGRYNKYSRTLPQSPWLIDGVRRAESSVQEMIEEPITPIVKPDECRFSSAGREDVDVRMLGEGRPFILEFINPQVSRLSQTTLSSLQQQINHLNPEIAVKDLQVVTKEECSKLKDAEMIKTKTYNALVWTEKETTDEDLRKLAQIKDLQLAQKTPIRVLHRRNLAVREKLIHSLKPVRVDSNHFRLYLKTQAGTYVKEFVHGDFGRTKPSLGTLLNTETDILELDVESVDVDWPPKICEKESGR